VRQSVKKPTKGPNKVRMRGGRGGGGLVLSQGDDVVVKFAGSKSVRENYA